MSIVEETRIVLLDLFPELAAADAEARAAAQAEAEAKAAAEEAAAARIDDEMDAMLSEMESIELIAGEEDESPAGGAEEEEPVEAAAPAEPEPEPEEPEEPEDEGPRQNGVMLTDHAARGTAIDVLCEPDQVVQAAEIMDEAGFYLESITGVDWIKDDKLEVVYDYNQFGMEPCRVAVRTFIPRTEPEIATISGVMPSANWHERETHDFYGIKFAGHPHLIPILLPEDADFHPLLKDFKP